jgi:trans-2,3-dihydro-3-hydroxyanthranilate isomerase
MPMAGHPTVGSTFALAHTGAIAKGRRDFVFGLNIGPVPVELEWTQGRLRFVWMTQSPPLFGEPIADRAGVVSAIGLTVDDLVPELPVQLVSCGVPYVIVVARDIDTVDRAVPDIGGFRRLCAGYGAETAIFLFALAGSGRYETVYSRMFAPGHGVVEDPATGRARRPAPHRQRPGRRDGTRQYDSR